MKERPRPATPLLLALVLACSGHAASLLAQAEPFEYELRLEEGSSFRQLVTMEQTHELASLPGAGLGMTIRVEQRFDVVAVGDDGTTTLRTTYEAVRVSGQGPLGPMEYDSRAPPDPVPVTVRAFAAMVGHGFDIVFGRDGGIRSVTGTEELQRRMLEDLGEGSGLVGDGAETLRRRMDGAFGDDSLSAMMSSFYAGFPDRPLEVGDSWTHDASLSGITPMRATVTWTLAGRRGGTAYLDIEGDIAAGDGTTMQAGPVTVHHRLTGEQRGSAELDEETGWMRRMRLESSVEGVMSFQGMDDGVSPREIPIGWEGVYSVEPLR